MKLRNKILLGVATLGVINLFANAYKNDKYMTKVFAIEENYSNVTARINTLEEIKKDVPDIMNADGVLEYICEKQITADSLTKEQEFYQKKADKLLRRAFIYGYFID